MVLGKTMPPIQAIEDFTNRYPWCAIGHKSLFAALCAQGEEAYLSYASKASVYLFNRVELFTLARTPRPVVVPLSSKKIEDELEIISDPVERMVRRGGGSDYFATSELDAVILEGRDPIDKFIKNNPKITPVHFVKEEQEKKVSAPEIQEEKASLLNVGDDNFMTETLAKIYADQSLYQLAIDAYEKLILLYPKKSDYFASLIQELKYKLIR